VDEGEQFRDLILRVHAGSEEATRELLQTYGDHIRRVVRRRLVGRLRRRFDVTDFEQSVWAAFFTRWDSFDRPEHLVAFLVATARKKVATANRRHVRAQKRAVGNERSLDGSAAAEVLLVPDGLPTPSQVAMGREKWDQIQECTPRRGHPILEMLRQGATHQEIASRLGVTKKTVQRLLRRLAGEVEP